MLLRSTPPAAAASEVSTAWSRRTERELTVWAMSASFALVGLDLLRLWHQTYAFYGGFEPVTRELAATIANDTVWGSGWKWQAISAAFAGVVFAACFRSNERAWAAAVPAAALVAVARPLTGHALEQGSFLSLPVVLQGIHVAAAATWLGTLLALIAVGLRGARGLPVAERARVAAALVGRFSPLALGSAVALFIAGCATSFLYLGSVGAAFSTTYGLVLVAKIAVFCLILAFGYYNWQRVGPRLDAALEAEGHDPDAQLLLVRSATGELCLAAVILLISSVLVSLPMPMG